MTNLWRSLGRVALFGVIALVVVARLTTLIALADPVGELPTPVPIVTDTDGEPLRVFTDPPNTGELARQELTVSQESPYQIYCLRKNLEDRLIKLRDAQGVGNDWLTQFLTQQAKRAHLIVTSPETFVAYQSFCFVIKNVSDAIGQFACFLFDTFVDPIFSPRQPTCAKDNPYITTPTGTIFQDGSNELPPVPTPTLTEINGRTYYVPPETTPSPTAVEQGE